MDARSESGVGVVDLYSPFFWLFVAVACVVLVPIVATTVRQLVLALVNLAFIGLVLRVDASLLFAGVLFVWLMLKASEGRLGALPAALLAALVLVLFLIHKRPGDAADVGLGAINPLLAAIGFSYVALRLAEVLRAVCERRHPAPSLPATINYLLPFHSLAAGPIQAYDDFVAQPGVPPSPTTAVALVAVERITAGLFKKFVLAFVVENVFLTGFRARGPYFVVEVQWHYLWLYLDFSAYSDIAVGIGGLLGVATPENFNKPYLARNMIDFWERWHISLSQFIRRNLFIPIQLALVRRTAGRYPLLIASFAFAVSFLLCGLWHSISLNWLAWGGIHAAGLIACNLYRGYLLKTVGRKGLNRYLANPWIGALAIVLTFEFVAFSLVPVGYRPGGTFR